MTTSSDFDRHSPVCEMVVSIVVKIPIYVEPVVIEAPTTCYGQAQVVDFGVHPSSTESTALANGVQSVINSDVEIVPAQPTLARTLQPVANGWRSLRYAIQDVFKAGMFGRSRFS